MSAYQFYEFIALEGPISDEGLAYAKGCSSRADVSPTHWRNEYSFGDFGGSVDRLMLHYDAHFYIANWGTVRLGLAFPEGCLDLKRVRPYLCESESASLKLEQVGDRWVIWWEHRQENGFGWTEGAGIIHRLVGIREELMRGDTRALFLGWLAGFWSEEEDEDEELPPVPSGLDRLSPALKMLVEQFAVDADALAAAVGISANEMAQPRPVSEVVDQLSRSEMKALLERVAVGDGSRVMSELNRQAFPKFEPANETSMSRGEFLARVIEIRSARLKKEQQAEAERQRLKAEAYQQHLVVVFKHADKKWVELDKLMEMKNATAYEAATNLLNELRDAYVQGGDEAAFQSKLSDFRIRYARRASMIRRIVDL